MKICNLKIDKQGRIQFPKSFLKANNIIEGDCGYMETINGNSNSVRFIFTENQ
jgi:bifunctional DNA-binding transcriptional regulator/antitoxin component of YhaV-PrlF toxin-antitoxin module|tara:strand:+ start:892 stop:1050 length:159 start_codon:yes stop_codon:yes gene_type:complete